MTRQEFENKYLNKLVEVRLFNDDIFKGELFSTNQYTRLHPTFMDLKNNYFVGTNIIDNTTRFRKSHIKKIRLLSCLNSNKKFRVVGEKE